MSKPKNLLGQLQVTDAGISITALRIIIALIFFNEGSGKLFGWFGHGGLYLTSTFFREEGFPFPLLLSYLVGTTEFACSLLIFVGFMTRFASFLLALIMFVAMMIVHRIIGYYYPLVLYGVFMVLMQYGAGKLSIDYYLSQTKS